MATQPISYVAPFPGSLARVCLPALAQELEGSGSRRTFLVRLQHSPAPQVLVCHACRWSCEREEGRGEGGREEAQEVAGWRSPFNWNALSLSRWICMFPQIVWKQLRSLRWCSRPTNCTRECLLGGTRTRGQGRVASVSITIRRG